MTPKKGQTDSDSPFGFGAVTWGMPVDLLVQIDRSKLATENNGPTELYWALWKADPSFQIALKRAGLGVVKISDRVWEVGTGGSTKQKRPK